MIISTRVTIRLALCLALILTAVSATAELAPMDPESFTRPPSCRPVEEVRAEEVASLVPPPPSVKTGTASPESLPYLSGPKGPAYSAALPRTGTVSWCRSPEYGATDVEIPVVANGRVRWFIKYFQTDARQYFVKWLERTPRYDTMIKTILREEGLPEDLFYIALIESGLNPRARSRANAVGIWQFMTATGREQGLRIDWWIDERRDPEKATLAATRYFKRLYGKFGSWHLAAAGYNGGEGRVARAVRRYNSNDYWELVRYSRALKRETRSYVPKYLAAMMISKDPEAFGFDDLEYSRAITYEKAPVPYATDLRVIARAAGVPVNELKRLNPELLQWFTPPEYPGYEIKLPAGTAGLFRENYLKVEAGRRLRFHRHKVLPGETLSEIARRYGTQVKLIVYFNNMRNPAFIRAGHTIVVPVRAAGIKKGKKLAYNDAG